jgi:hypothetical protein
VNDHAITDAQIREFGGSFVFVKRGLGHNSDSYEGVRRGFHGDGIFGYARHSADDVLFITMGQSRGSNQRNASDENQGAEFHLASPLVALILRA